MTSSQTKIMTEDKKLMKALRQKKGWLLGKVNFPTKPGLCLA